MPDLARRKAVMSRSIKLGHCVCDPRQPCPCELFRERDVCQCAGERLPKKSGDVPLTRHVRKAGCASKIGQADLLRIVQGLPEVTDPDVLVGTAAGDDAGIYRLDEDTALVQTVDVFTPCVDDPYLFGKIAAANSVSDVYAMGGRPVSALSVVGFPVDKLDDDILARMLSGGMEKLAEADCALIGGHSMNDEEIKLGFAVTGLISPEMAVRRARARPGDVLVLTKPIGTGMVSFAAQLGRADEACLGEVGASMAALNRDAAELMVTHGAHACTDITGFGLAGHLVEMMRTSDVSVEVDLSCLPVFRAVQACIECEILSGAIERNQQYAMGWIEPEGGDIAALAVLYDPQTSGGLLVALPEKNAASFVEEMHSRGNPAATIVGRVREKPAERNEGTLAVAGTELQNFFGSDGGIKMAENRQNRQDSEGGEACCESPPVFPAGEDREQAPEASCCGPSGDAEGDAAASTEARAIFSGFMKAANRPGRIDRRAKKLMGIVLSIAHRCRSCLLVHLKAARAMGMDKEEVDEAANLAIAFGGCAAMMFYREVCEQLDW